jgi:hypothetical protein
MSIFLSPQSLFDYPAYIFQAVVENVSGYLNDTQTLQIGIISTLINLGTNQPPGSTDFLTSLFATIQSFCEDYDWTADYGSEASLQSFTITEFTEVQTDVTPS